MIRQSYHLEESFLQVKSAAGLDSEPTLLNKYEGAKTEFSWKRNAARHTRIDELQLGNLPSFFGRDLLLDLSDLMVTILFSPALTGCWLSCKNTSKLTVSDGSASMVNFCCFKSCRHEEFTVSDASLGENERRRTDLEGELHLRATNRKMRGWKGRW